MKLYNNMNVEEHLELADKFEFQESNNAYTEDGKPSKAFIGWLRKEGLLK